MTARTWTPAELDEAARLIAGELVGVLGPDRAEDAVRRSRAFTEPEPPPQLTAVLRRAAAAMRAGRQPA